MEPVHGDPNKDFPGEALLNLLRWVNDNNAMNQTLERMQEIDAELLRVTPIVRKWRLALEAKSEGGRKGAERSQIARASRQSD